MMSYGAAGSESFSKCFTMRRWHYMHWCLFYSLIFHLREQIVSSRGMLWVSEVLATKAWHSALHWWWILQDYASYSGWSVCRMAATLKAPAVSVLWRLGSYPALMPPVFWQPLSVTLVILIHHGQEYVFIVGTTPSILLYTRRFENLIPNTEDSWHSIQMCVCVCVRL